MKSLLSFLFGVLFLCVNAQIGFIPTATHYTNPYNVTVNGNGTLYYTTDGSTPTLSSTSSVNNFVVNIDQNKTIKVFLVNASGTASAVESKKYYTGTIPTAKVYFKPPATWTSACAMVFMEKPNSYNGAVVDPLYPGYSMTDVNCDGWYKGPNLPYEEGYAYFTNCAPTPSIPQAINTPGLIVGSVVYYDFTLGPITNPPACLFLGTNEAKEKITLVKILQNPVAKSVHFETDLKFKEYSILNFEGKILKKGILNSNSIEVSFLPKRNYLIQLISNEKENVVIQFIKN